MAETPSSMIPLGTIAPDFTLIDSKTGQPYSLTNSKLSKGTVIAFICNHCPYVKHIQAKLVAVANHYQPLGIQFIAINSNDIDTHPQDGPQYMALEAQKHGYSFPYLFDESQAVAKAYHAACTPDFFIFDDQLRCVYRGRFDESTPANQKPVTGNDLSNALDCLLSNRPIPTEQKHSLGCNIKWKKR